MKDASNLRDYFKKWPQFYYFIHTLVGPWWTGVSAKEFLRKYGKAGVTLNLGSGPRVIDSNVTNVDIFSYAGVDVVADILSLPFASDSASTIISDNVLEHLEDPGKAVKEMLRVLAPRGMLYVATPFLYPFHASPDDYTRWTHVGLKNLLKDFEIVEIGVRAGPFSGLAIWFSYLFSSLLCFGSETLYWWLLNLSMFVFFPLKILDIVASRLPFAINLASVLYVVARKK